MNAENTDQDSRPLRSIINLQDNSITSIMDLSSRKFTTSSSSMPLSSPSKSADTKKLENSQSFSYNYASKRLFPVSYFSLEALVLLVCLTASLLILPLVLPPLPPPPFLFLLIPIGILGLLMLLAFMPSNAKDISYTYL